MGDKGMAGMHAPDRFLVYQVEGVRPIIFDSLRDVDDPGDEVLVAKQLLQNLFFRVQCWYWNHQGERAG